MISRVVALRVQESFAEVVGLLEEDALVQVDTMVVVGEAEIVYFDVAHHWKKTVNFILTMSAGTVDFIDESC